jgi:hydrogenase nickel incorporation protein HypA/HybF
MHELSLCEGILKVLEEQAEAQGFRRVRTVILEIGGLAGVEIEALRFGFDSVMTDSLAQGARLEIVELPGQAWCMNCAAAVAIAQRYDSCPRCGGYQLQVTGGDQMRIKELEVE